MAEIGDGKPQGERIRKAIKWLSESQLNEPHKERLALIREAGIRFNLTPKECIFLEINFTGSASFHS